MIKTNKTKYFQDVNNASRSNPYNLWPELISVIPKINPRSIPKYTTANECNIFFKGVPDKVIAVCDKGKPLLSIFAHIVNTFKSTKYPTIMC